MTTTTAPVEALRVALEPFLNETRNWAPNNGLAKEDQLLNTCRIATTTELTVGDLRTLRDAMQAHEQLLIDCAQILDAVKPEWKAAGSWSEWDESVRARISLALGSAQSPWVTQDDIGRPVDPETGKAALTAFPATDEMREALAGLLPWLEDAETKCLVGHEGCVWAVEQVRAALDGQPAQKPPQSPATDEGTLKRGNGTGGWTIDPDLLRAIRDDAGEWAKESCLETVQAIALAVEHHLSRARVAPATDDIGRLVERLQEASSTVISLSAAELCGAATALLSQQSEINRLVEALGEVVEARMPGQARRIAREALSQEKKS